MKRVWGLGSVVFLGLFGLVAVGACGGPARPVAAPTENPVVSAAPAGIDAPLASDPEPVAVPEHRSATDEFLLVTVPELLLASTDGRRTVLATDVQGATYDPARELVWTMGETLRVYDLRRRPSESVLIASGIDGGSRLSINQDEDYLSPDDACDLPYLQLEWTAEPSVEGVIEPMGEPKLEGQAWLASELNRSKRTVPASSNSEFDLRSSDAHIKLPKKQTSCEEASDCGKTVPFAGWGIELVLVYEQQGGDCWEAKCVLHDPKTDKFSHPPVAEHWGTLAETKPGSCGPYQFDAAGESFIYKQALCTKEGCKDVGGYVVGWLEPGPTVGMPGNFAE